MMTPALHLILLVLGFACFALSALSWRQAPAYWNLLLSLGATFVTLAFIPI